LSGSSSDLLSLARSDSTCSTLSMLQQQHGGVPELLIGLSYNGTTGRLTVEIVKGSHFRNISLGKAPDTYVKLCLVSSMGQEMARAKTSTKRGQPNPLFKETFVFQVCNIIFCVSSISFIFFPHFQRSHYFN
jgi:synaptotagmin-14/16